MPACHIGIPSLEKCFQLLRQLAVARQLPELMFGAVGFLGSPVRLGHRLQICVAQLLGGACGSSRASFCKAILGFSPRSTPHWPRVYWSALYAHSGPPPCRARIETQICTGTPVRTDQPPLAGGFLKAYVMNNPSAPDVGTFLDNADPGPHAQPAPAARRAGRPAAVHLYGLRLCAGVRVSGRVSGPAGSASRGPAADWDAAQRLEVPTLYPPRPAPPTSADT